MPPSTNKDRNDLVVTPTPPTDDESAQWVRFTLKKLTRLAISTRLVSPGALDEKGLLCDERLLRDLVRTCCKEPLSISFRFISFHASRCFVFLFCVKWIWIGLICERTGARITCLLSSEAI